MLVDFVIFPLLSSGGGHSFSVFKWQDPRSAPIHDWCKKNCRYCVVIATCKSNFSVGTTFPYCVVNWNLIQSIRLFYSHVIVSQLYNTVLYSIHYLTHMVRLRLCCILNGGKKSKPRRQKKKGCTKGLVASQKWNKKRILLTCCSILDKRTPEKKNI